MDGKLRHIVSLFIVMVLVYGTLGAAITVPQQVLNNSNELLAANLPITYGDVVFRQRILERTKGEREPIGLVLSGGSARAFAHIGVLKYLEEQDIVPDFIISNSMGSIVALLYAAGLSPDQIITVCSSVDLGQLFNLTLPLGGGILDTSQFSALINSFLGKSPRLEELPIPVMVVAEDLATKRQIRICEGDLLTVMEASFVLPVYFSPTEYQGHLLVDGGITNLVPLDIAYDYSDSVLVSTAFYEGSDLNLRNPITILNTSIDIAKRRQGVVELLRHPETLWIRCMVEGFSFMDFKSMRQIASIGYDSAAKYHDELCAMETMGLDERINKVRADFSAREKRVLGNYRLFNHVYQERFSNYMFFSTKSFLYEDDPWLLRDELVVGISYNIDWKSLVFELNGGFGWESTSVKDIYPMVTGSLSVFPFPFLALSTDLSISMDQNWLPSWYNRTGVELRQLLAGDRLSLRFLGSLEHQFSPVFALQGMLLNVGGFVGWQDTGSAFHISAEGGWQLAHAYDRSFAYAKLRSSVPVVSDVDLKLSFNGRFALDGAGDVPFYQGDQFRTSEASIRTQGSLSPTGAANPCGYLMTANMVLSWQPAGFKPTMGEMVIIEDSSIRIFNQMLWYQAGQLLPSFVYGLQLSTRISFLGLKNLPLSVYVGYDSPADSVVWGFIFGKQS